MSAHHLPAGAKSCHWGYFDAALPPVLSVKSGERVVIDTVSGAPEHLPTKPGYHIPPELYEVHAHVPPIIGPHILTGPVYVEGARPGTVLEVRILDVKLFQTGDSTSSFPSSARCRMTSITTPMSIYRLMPKR